MNRTPDEVVAARMEKAARDLAPLMQVHGAAVNKIIKDLGGIWPDPRGPNSGALHYFLDYLREYNAHAFEVYGKTSVTDPIESFRASAKKERGARFKKYEEAN